MNSPLEATAAGAPDPLLAQVRELVEIPPLPESTQHLLSVLGDEDLDLVDLARVLEGVPPLAARIVGLAGSAFFGCPGRVRSVTDAIVRVLGLRLVRSLAFGIAVSGVLDTRRCPRFSTEQYWQSAVVTATLARLLAGAVSTADPVVDGDQAYLCGLLHNLGVLAIVHVAPERMDEVLRVSAEEPQRPLTEIEVERLGFNHCQAGAVLAARWHLPACVQHVMMHHHRIDYRDADWPLALLVGLASQWGRQRLAGVAEPWIEPAVTHALGLREEALASALAHCEAALEDVEQLGRMFAGGG